MLLVLLILFLPLSSPLGPSLLLVSFSVYLSYFMDRRPEPKQKWEDASLWKFRKWDLRGMEGLGINNRRAYTGENSIHPSPVLLSLCLLISFKGLKNIRGTASWYHLCPKTLLCSVPIDLLKWSPLLSMSQDTITCWVEDWDPWYLGEWGQYKKCGEDAVSPVLKG